MPKSTPEVERRALALFERLNDQPSNTRLRSRLLKNEPEAVVSRLRALENSAAQATGAIPTLVPGSADCDSLSPPPERVGPFRMVERIGRGGMGDVWLGERCDGLFEQRVAIKLIQRHALARAAAAFDDERRFLAKLEHPNIARLIDGGVTDDGLPWLAMEFIEGQLIDAACRTISTDQSITLFIRAAEAVQHAHSRMIAHADLKPANILVAKDGQVKLLDFGIAALIGTTGAGRIGSGPVTRDFASPERLAGGGPSVADDVFALGKTLSLLLTGRSEPELEAVAAKAQQVDERQRYGSVASLINDLERWRTHFPVSAMPASLHYQIGKFVDRHRAGVLTTGAALILLSATSLIATNNYVRAERSRATAEKRFDEVRTLSHFMLFDLYDELARQPGTVARRAEIAQKAALYLDRLRLDRTAKADLRLDTAQSYRRLAAILGLPGVSNLGRPEDAARALDRAEKLLVQLLADQTTNATARAELGWVEADRWLLKADNVDSPRANLHAREQFDAALRMSPGLDKALLGRLTTQKSEGYDLIWNADKPAEALAVLRPALDSLRRHKWPVALQPAAEQLEINLLNRIGDATYYTGDVPASLAPYFAADALVDAGIKRDGALPQWLILKGENAFNISGSLSEIAGREAEALMVARSGKIALRQLLAFGPDAAAEKKLLVLLGQEAALLDEAGRTTEALAPSLESVALRRARLSRSPDDPQRMRDLAIGLAPNAELLAKAGQRTKACAAATQALGTWMAIKAAGRLGAKDAKKNLPHSGTLADKYCTS